MTVRRRRKAVTKRAPRFWAPPVGAAGQWHPWRHALEPIPTVFNWYKGNVAEGTLLLAAFLVVKGYVLAKGDIPTALGILQYAGLTSVVIAGLLSSLPILAAAMLGWTVYRTVRALLPVPRGPGDGRPPRDQKLGSLAVVTLGTAALSAVVTPWTFMVGAIGIGLLIGVLLWLPRLIKPGPKPTWARLLDWSVRLVIGLVIGLIVLYALIAMLYTVWLPHEVVAFATGPLKKQRPPPAVGYVMADDPDGWITILTTGEHQIVRYRDPAVKSIELCQRAPDGFLSHISNATTLWDEVTKPSFLRVLHAPVNPRCPPAG